GRGDATHTWQHARKPPTAGERAGAGPPADGEFPEGRPTVPPVGPRPRPPPRGRAAAPVAPASARARERRARASGTPLMRFVDWFKTRPLPVRAALTLAACALLGLFVVGAVAKIRGKPMPLVNRDRRRETS